MQMHQHMHTACPNIHYFPSLLNKNTVLQLSHTLVLPPLGVEQC